MLSHWPLSHQTLSHWLLSHWPLATEPLSHLATDQLKEENYTSGIREGTKGLSPPTPPTAANRRQTAMPGPTRTLGPFLWKPFILKKDVREKMRNEPCETKLLATEPLTTEPLHLLLSHWPLSHWPNWLDDPHKEENYMSTTCGGSKGQSPPTSPNRRQAAMPGPTRTLGPFLWKPFILKRTSGKPCALRLHGQPSGSRGPSCRASHRVADADRDADHRGVQQRGAVTSAWCASRSVIRAIRLSIWSAW